VTGELRPWWIRLARALAPATLLVVMVVVAVTATDALTAARGGTAGAAAPARRAPARAFVLFVDSLPARLALELPALRAVARDGVRARVDNGGAVETSSAVRVALTGRRQEGLVALAQNLRGHGGGTSSLFSQLAAAGTVALVYSDDSFNQFSRSVRLASNDVGDRAESEIARQSRAFAGALDAFTSHAADVVLFHVTAGDHAAHELGTADPRYGETWMAIDALVQRAARAVGPSETLLVFGDHGHDGRGRHFPGLDIPTFFAYRGPAFRAGVDLGTRPLSVHRYLLGAALDLPLEGYLGEPALEAFVRPPPAELGYAHPPQESPDDNRRPATLIGLALLALGVGAVGGAAARWLLVPRLSLAGAVAAGAGLGLASLCWGFLLAWYRKGNPPLSQDRTALVWLVVGLVALAAVKLRALSWTRATGIAMRIGFLLRYPTTDWYGWAVSLVPTWLIAVGLLWGTRAAGRTRALAAKLACLPPLLLPFIYGWRGYLSSNHFGYWIALVGVSLGLLFVRPAWGRRVNGPAIAVGVLLLLVHFGHVVDGAGAKLALSAALFAAGLWLRPWRAARDAKLPAAAREHLRSVFFFAATALVFKATTAIEDQRVYLQLYPFAAALTITRDLFDALAASDERRSADVILGVLAFVAAGWCSLGFSLFRLEWSFLYAFLPQATVEQHELLLVAGIAVRYLLPFVCIAFFLPGALAPRLVFGAVALRCLSLVLAAAGMAAFGATHEKTTALTETLVLTLCALAVPLTSAIRSRAAVLPATRI